MVDAINAANIQAGRIKGVTIVKPVVYGNMARYFGKKREEDGHTHQWTVYVRPYRNEDMATYVKKVHFKLHDSYANCNRVVTKPPYEVTETGWGEFEIAIKIFFIDPNERPVTIYHLLKLFQTETDIMLGKKSLVVEFLDQIIFQEPSASMQALLSNPRPLTLGTYKHDVDFEERKIKTLQNILTAKKKMKNEVALMNNKLKMIKEAINRYKEELAGCEGNVEKNIEN